MKASKGVSWEIRPTEKLYVQFIFCFNEISKDIFNRVEYA